MGPWSSCPFLCSPFRALHPAAFSSCAFPLPCVAAFALAWLRPDLGWVFVVLAVRELLDMASSRGIPGAQAQLELALHCLHQAHGSVPVRSGSWGAGKRGQAIHQPCPLPQPFLPAPPGRHSTRSTALAACLSPPAAPRPKPKWLQQGQSVSWRHRPRLPQPAALSVWRSVCSETFGSGWRGNCHKPQPAEATLGER